MFNLTFIVQSGLYESRFLNSSFENVLLMDSEVKRFNLSKTIRHVNYVTL